MAGAGGDRGCACFVGRGGMGCFGRRRHVTMAAYVNADFGAADDCLHAPSDSFYDNETFWYSIFVPERRLGAWLYTGVRQHPGITHGGMWVWDDSGWLP